MADNVACVSQWSNLSTRIKSLVSHIGNYGERYVQDFVGKSEGKKMLVSPRHRWEDNTKMGPKEVGLRPWTESMSLKIEVVFELLRMR